jgi:transposase
VARIGIDELSYRKGQRHIMVVVDHDSGRLVWAAEGRCQDTLRAFFDAPGPERAALLAEVSADGAEWIGCVVPVRRPRIGSRQSRTIKIEARFRWLLYLTPPVFRSSFNARVINLAGRRA